MSINLMTTKVTLLMVVIGVLVVTSLAGCNAMTPSLEDNASDTAGSKEGHNSSGEEHHGDPIGSPEGTNRPAAEATERAVNNRYGGEGFDPAQQELPAGATDAPATPGEPGRSQYDSGGTAPMPASGCADPSVLTPQQAAKCYFDRQSMRDSGLGLY